MQGGSPPSQRAAPRLRHFLQTLCRAAQVTLERQTLVTLQRQTLTCVWLREKSAPLPRRPENSVSCAGGQRAAKEAGTRSAGAMQQGARGNGGHAHARARKRTDERDAVGFDVITCVCDSIA